MNRIAIVFMIFMLPMASFAYSNPEINEMGQLIEEISVLNLLRGIYLSEEQAREISGYALEAEKLRKEYLAKIRDLNSLPVLSQLRDELYTALAEAPPPVRDEAVELDNQAHAITGEMLTKIAELEDKVKKVLNHGQQKIFWEFVPCVVPEYDFENPVRTGQAAASSRMMPVAEFIRTTSEELWLKHGQAYLDRILKIIEQEVGKLTDDSREDLRRRLVKHAWKIRRMKEADYQIHRDKLAEELLLINREHTFRSGFRVTGKIARFFLSPAAAKIFPRWLETHYGQMKEVEEKKSDTNLNPPNSPSQDLSGKAIDDAIESVSDSDEKFWAEAVPNSLENLVEPPYINHFYHAFGKPYYQTLVEEDRKYVDIFELFKDASAILTRERELTFYTLTQGDP